MLIGANKIVVGLVLLANREQPQASAALSLVNLTEHHRFTDELTTLLYTKDNECTSALGVSMAFSLIYPGSTGDGKDQIRNVLGYPTGSNAQLVWEDTAQRMLGDSDGRCVGNVYDGVCESEAPLLQIANSIWFDDGNTLDQGYELVVGHYAKQIDFKADDSSRAVNDWVKNSTNGLIESIVDADKPLYPPYVLIAINSIYLKASWAEQFSKYKTNLDSFYGSASRTLEVSKAHFMNGVFDSLHYSHKALPEYQVVALPFASSQMSMIFVLPMNDKVEPIRSSDLISALDNLEYNRVALSVPKFKFESMYEDDLKAAIAQTGIVAPFNGGSLCGLFKDENGCEALRIDRVIQKTVIDVNEEGVEAAAVTAIFIRESPGPVYLDEPILMVLDHPFQFFIYDKSENLVLFEGHLGLPKVPEIQPTIQLLDLVHSDIDFWLKEFNVDPVDPYEDISTASNATSPTASPDSLSSAKPATNSAGLHLFIICFEICLVEMGADIWVIVCLGIVLGIVI